MPAGDKKYLTTDNVRLQQVVNNLINNAAKFTGSGFITFGYEEDEEPGYTRIFVEDTGVGISEEGIRHIFERFYKVDNFTQGAGLGLSICQTIVERLKGTISVTSEVGKGTRFTVRLPNYCEYTPVPATNNTKTAAYIIERSFLSIVSENEHCSYSLID